MSELETNDRFRFRFTTGSLFLLMASFSFAAAGAVYVFRTSSSRSIEDHFMFSILVLIGPMLLMILAGIVYRVYRFFVKETM